MFKPYIHVERLDSDETEGILCGTVEITPKMDGTNGCVWYDGEHHVGSRKREITVEDDNAGFANWYLNDDNEGFALRTVCETHPNWIVYGEWMGDTKFVGNIKDYEQEAKGRFFIFDVYDTDKGMYLPHFFWREECPVLDLYAVPIIATLDNPTIEDIVAVANGNKYMLDHATHLGEGVVIRRDGFKNKYGRYAVAKLVLDEYKQNKRKAQREIDAESVESNIVSFFVTPEELNKTMAKTEVYFGEPFDRSKGKMVGFYLNTVVRDCVWDECANWVKKFKPNTVDFGVLQYLAQAKAREYIGL